MKFFAFSTLLLLVGGFHPKENPPIESRPIEGRPKNIILLIGDGMGLSQVSAALYKNNLHLSLEQFPVIGFQKTYSANNLVTDSAAAGTAMACGHKTDNNVLGMNQAGESCKSILEEAIEQGYATGMVVTSSIQHATPGAFVSHRPARNLYEDITKDLLNSGIDLFIGGGKQFFDRRETDDQNLLKALKSKGFIVYDYFNDDLSTVMFDPSKRLAFLTADNQPLPAFQGRDYLPIASKKAADFLNLRSDKGFFLMIEGSQIDWSCHANQVEPMYAELEDFDKAIEQAMKFARVDGETLVIVTADHETGGLGLNSGGPRTIAPKFTTNGHTAAMVPVFAYGPKSELFRGIYENTEIYHKMRMAFGFSEN